MTAAGAYRPPTKRELRARFPSGQLRWYEYAEAWLHFPLGRYLDFGCGEGDFLRRVLERCDECWGVDLDPAALGAAERIRGVRALPIQPDAPLPFDGDSFDTITILEVIEHVADERSVLRDLARVLRPGGYLLLTTPHKGLLTFLDPGNVKFLMPRLHRFVHLRLLGDRTYYERRFGAERRCDRKMVADFTLDQEPWHRHYRYGEIRALAPQSLRTVVWAVYYPAFRAFAALRQALRVLTRGTCESLPGPLQALNFALSRVQTRWGDQLVVLFQKRISLGSAAGSETGGPME